MLTKISVENFKSFNERAELSMIPSSKIRKHPDHCARVGQTRILKHTVVYGANASGKTNLIEVFQFVRFVLLNGLPTQSGKLFCRTDVCNADRDSVFEFQFSIGERFFAYGFSVLLSKHEIKSEWLYELLQSGSAKCVFEREQGKMPEIALNLDKNERRRFEIYASDFVSNDSTLFLSEMNRGKRFEPESRLAVFSVVFHWLVDNIAVYTPNSKVTDLRYYYDQESLDKINRLITTFDTGISNVRIEEITLDEVKKAIPEEILTNILNDMVKAVTNNGNKPIRMSMRSDNVFFSIEMDEHLIPCVKTIKLKHAGSSFVFNFDDESDGSRRIFDLLDMLLINDTDVVFVVDELERSLHPMLTRHFLELFAKLHRNQRVQLIFTTHESSIMDQECFRRDEFWLVERNAQNTSIIYPLDRFKERYDKDLSKAYLNGRYGAIPVFTGLNMAEE